MLSYITHIYCLENHTIVPGNVNVAINISTKRLTVIDTVSYIDTR